MPKATVAAITMSISYAEEFASTDSSISEMLMRITPNVYESLVKKINEPYVEITNTFDMSTSIDFTIDVPDLGNYDDDCYQGKMARAYKVKEIIVNHIDRMLNEEKNKLSSSIRH